MSIVYDLAIGAGGIIIAGAISSFTPPIRRLFHVAKRVDRLEMVIPVLLRSNLAVLRCQKAGVCNGETDKAIEEIDKLLTDGIISRKPDA